MKAFFQYHKAVYRTIIINFAVNKSVSGNLFPWRPILGGKEPSSWKGNWLADTGINEQRKNNFLRGFIRALIKAFRWVIAEWFVRLLNDSHRKLYNHLIMFNLSFSSYDSLLKHSMGNWAKIEIARVKNENVYYSIMFNLLKIFHAYDSLTTKGKARILISTIKAEILPFRSKWCLEFLRLRFFRAAFWVSLKINAQ